MTLRLVFLGTGTFALPTFRGLYETGHEVVGLVTQPDRTGRGHHRHQNPLKTLAEENATAVFQPAKANAEEAIARLQEFQADLFVVAAYGQILSAELLEIPRLGAINLHASLLPKYRGAAPIQYALLCGETETGVTIFQIEPGLDAGPVLGMTSTAIGESETYGELQDRLSDLAVPLAKQVIEQLAKGTATPRPQDVSQVTRAPRLAKEQGQIPWQKSARLVCCHIRGVQPWPKPSTTIEMADGSQLQLLILSAVPADRRLDGGPGAIAVVDRKRLFV
ncbi:MAG: methionyl-tRNA formyltransferase, partial [Planctomycetaceae bacterium]